MEFESIKRIMETEKEAERKREVAKQKAKEILEHAHNSKESNRVYFKGQLERKTEDLRKEKNEENKKEKVKIQAQTNEKLRKLQATLHGNLSEAVDKIFSEVIKIWDKIKKYLQKGMIKGNVNCKNE